MPPPLLTLEEVHLTFGGSPLLSGVTLSIQPLEKIALVGRNGSGKSTLMKIIAGNVEPDDGVRFADPKATVFYLPQEPDLSNYKTVEHYIESLEPGFAVGADPQLVTTLRDALGIKEDIDIKVLSGGEARKIALIRALAHKPDILLLDEPTNHLDIATIEWLENYLRRYRSALILISHDRRFLETLTDKCIWLDRGIVRSRSSGFVGFEDWRDKILDEEALEHHKLGRKIAAEEDWVRYGVTARRKRNVRRMKELQELRSSHKNARKSQGSVNFSANESGPSGKVVIEAKNISKSYDDRAIIDDFSIRITRGERIGLVGYNGAGKTTLLNLLIGKLLPDEGTIKIGSSLELVSLDQRREGLTPGMRVADAITDGRGDFVTLGESKRHVASYLKDFLFAPEQWRSPVDALSGGERGRLALAAALAKPSNLLVLDEPTNDLDLETLDLLQDMLADYQGTLILVSHDRSFLDRTVTSVISRHVHEQQGLWTRYAGGYTDMLAQRQPTEKQSKMQSSKQTQKTQKTEKVSAHARGSKLSYKDKHALETLPVEIESMENEIQKARGVLEPADLFQRDPDLFSATVKKLETLETDLAQAEEKWLELEMKREALE